MTLDPNHDATLAMLRALRDAEADTGTPARVRAAVMAAWDNAHSSRHGSPGLVTADPVPSSVFWRRGRPAGARVLRPVAALAAGVMLTAALAQLGTRLQSALPALPVQDAALHLIGEPILDGEPLRVVRLRLPIAALAALGVRSIGGDSLDAVDVDVIVGEDGVARAIQVGG
jgi:hypothetical protein